MQGQLVGKAVLTEGIWPNSLKWQCTFCASLSLIFLCYKEELREATGGCGLRRPVFSQAVPLGGFSPAEPGDGCQKPTISVPLHDIHLMQARRDPWAVMTSQKVEQFREGHSEACRYRSVLTQHVQSPEFKSPSLLKKKGRSVISKNSTPSRSCPRYILGLLLVFAFSFFETGSLSLCGPSWPRTHDLL